MSEISKRKFAIFALVITRGIFPLSAEIVKVTVGDTGCPGRQLAVKHLWEEIRSVSSVTVLPRQGDHPPASRIFVIVSQGPCPDSAMLQTALGQRAKRYPILNYQHVPQGP